MKINYEFSLSVDDTKRVLRKLKRKQFWIKFKLLFLNMRNRKKVFTLKKPSNQVRATGAMPILGWLQERRKE